jgi:metallo-beta-lactamase family protein
MLKTQGEVLVESLGAAETVTGSKHLLRTPELAVLIDCGLFQGHKELRQRNWAKLPVDLAEIDVMVLTHAHLDHCGYIPLLIKDGFKGKIYCTPPTKELAQMILLDSAKIQEEDAERANAGKYSSHNPALPLYTVDEAQKSFDSFVTIDHNVVTKLSNNISFQFIRNGHILGSCFVDMDCFGKKIVFSGDIGRYNSGFLADPEFIDAADFLFLESTYGDRLHDKEDPSIPLGKDVSATLNRGGNVLIPAFAVGRAQEVMKILSELEEAGTIPANTPIYLDSPMAAKATDILSRFSSWHIISPDMIERMHKNVIVSQDFGETHKIIFDKHPKIVIASSGMLTGGRVLEYLKFYGPNAKNTILLMGYQGEGTTGRDLEDGKKEAQVHGKWITINAQVLQISGLSAHGDQGEMMRWLNGFKTKPQKIFLIHGEEGSMEVFKQKIEADLHIPVQIMPPAEPVQLFKL